MINEILQEIKHKVEKENRSPMELYMGILMIFNQVARNQILEKDQVVSLCSSLLTFYLNQNEEK